MINDIVKNLTIRTNTVDIIVLIVGLLVVIMLRRYVKPLMEQLTTGHIERRKDDNDLTIKDWMIESYRSMERIHARQDTSEENQKAMIETMSVIQTEIKAINEKVDYHGKKLNDHLFEADVLIPQVKKLLNREQT